VGKGEVNTRKGNKRGNKKETWEGKERERERQWSIFEGNERETQEGQERIRGKGEDIRREENKRRIEGRERRG
jgi:hypothetical protein